MAHLLVDKREQAFETDGLNPDEEIRLRNDIGKFVVGFIKSVLQTSFYRTKHKVTQQSVDDFMATMEPLKDFFNEISLQATADERKPDFTLEGIFVEPVQLSTCIKSVLRDEFLGKLRDYFVWNKLVALSIADGLEREEFVTFLDISTRKLEFVREKAVRELGQAASGSGTSEQPAVGTSEQPAVGTAAQPAVGTAELAAVRTSYDTSEHTPVGASYDTSEHTPVQQMDRLSDLLLSQDIVNVTAICRDELVFVDRQLPWRVKLALSRMMKNLKDLPLYSKATRRQIQDAKTLLLKEIIRPLRGQGLLMQFLLNCDLVSSAAVDLEGLDIEGEILHILKRDQLQRVSASFLYELKRLAAADPVDQEQMTKAVDLLRKCALPLSDVLNEETMGIFREAVKLKYIDEAELPENVQRHLRIEQQADDFLQAPKDHLRQFLQVRDAEGFRDKASSAVLLAGELMHRGAVYWTFQLGRVLQRMATPDGGGDARVQQLAQESLDAIGTKDNFDRLIRAIGTLGERDLKAVHGFARLFKRRLVPFFINQLSEGLKEEQRLGIRAALQQMNDPEVAAFVRKALGRQKQVWQYYRDLLYVMGNHKDPEGYQLANVFCGDEVPEVRAAAYTAISRIDGKRAERELLRGLMDPDQTVRRTVVVFLGEVGSQQSEFLDFLRKLFLGRLQPGAGAQLAAIFKRKLGELILSHLQLLNSGAKAVNKLANQKALPIDTFEPALVRTLRDQSNVRFFRGGPKAVDERNKLIALLLNVLKLAGTRLSLATLRNVRDYSEKETRYLATTALREIKAREGISGEEKWYHRAVRWLKSLVNA